MDPFDYDDGWLPSRMAFETMVLLGSIRVPVDVSQTKPNEVRAWCPHWPGVSVFAHSWEGAKASLQYELEARMARGESPVLQMSP
jgi:hypothetical protein